MTGGTGFVGGHLVDAPVADTDVRVLDSERTYDFAAVPDEAALFEGDVDESEADVSRARGRLGI
ncbi:MAG: hypothetical protein V5A44_13415 [Haloarculaceae archaeon]